MRIRRPASERLLPAAVASLVILLLILAILQYRWIGEIGEAERERLQAALVAAAERAAGDLDREVTRVWVAFQPSPDEDGDGRRAGLVRQLRSWREESPEPRLVRDLFIIVHQKEGQHALERLEEPTGRFVPAPWPGDLQDLREQLRERPSARRRLRFQPVDATAPALILPLARTQRGREDSPQRRDLAVIRLDRRYLGEELIPSVVERHFSLASSGGLRVAVLAPEEPVWRSDPQLPAERYLPGDLTHPVLGLRGGLDFRDGRGGRQSRVILPPPSRGPRAGEPWFLAQGPWRLVVSHVAGSFDAAVARARWRNLALSSVILVLLAASMAVLVVAAQRARRLARQKIELVAGITHELNTPLAAIRSAGQNLADGVVTNPDQVRRYGALVEREGKRLSALVGQALKLAGIESGAPVWRPEPVSVADVVREAVADHQWLLLENEMQVETDLPDGLPDVLIDRGALGLILRNLLDNAARYAASGRWIGLRARAEGGDVVLEVADRGPGVRPEDRPHLFEPFYRGREVVASASPGSGLGLDLVRRAAAAHGGRVAVGPGPNGRGTTFTVRLPRARGDQ